MNIIDIFEKFPTQKDCITYLESIKWKNGAVCPYCKSNNSKNYPNENRHFCKNCRTSFSVNIGTIFHDTRIPLQKWILAIVLILNAKKGISSRQLARDIDVTVKTAWSMQMRVRKAMQHDGNLLNGIVEMDEVYVGGKPKKPNKDGDNDNNNKRGRGTKKTPIVGIVERNGSVVAESKQKGDKLTFKVLNRMVNKFVDKNNSILCTDEFKGYKPFKKEGFNHFTINHSKGEYSSGFVSTNTIEGFWSLLRRGITGQYHWLSDKYIDNYINEFC